MNRLLRIAAVTIATITLGAPLTANALDSVINATITKLGPRIGGYTVPTGTHAFFFEINGTYTNTCGGSSPSAWFGIDNALLDSTQYRDHVATAQLAYSFGSTVNIYYDGCVGGFRRAVGIDVF